MDDMIKSVEYLCLGDRLFTVVQVKTRSKARAFLDGEVYPNLRNELEPYDFTTDVFEFPRTLLEKVGKFELELTFWSSIPAFLAGESSIATERYPIVYDSSDIVDHEIAVTRSDRGLVFEALEESGNGEDFEYDVKLYRTPSNEPVRVYTLLADTKTYRFVAGTPDGKTFFDGSTQTVMGEAEVVASRGEKVLAAFNADFYDMFATCRPSGLCLTRGTVVSGEGSERPFLGLTKNGEIVISSLAEISTDKLSEAVSGMQMLVVDGKICDTAPLEPFGDIAHPRTAVGLREDGRLIVLVVDGRRPDWSNGASLTELAKLMIERGAVRALNMDGGGSSTFIVKKNGELRMLNHPADKQRPLEDLIRPVFDSIVLVSR